MSKPPRIRNKKELTLTAPPPPSTRSLRGTPAATPSTALSPLFSPDEEVFEGSPISSQIESNPTGRLSLPSTSSTQSPPTLLSPPRSVEASSLGSPFRLDSSSSEIFNQQQQQPGSLPLPSPISYDVEMENPPTPSRMQEWRGDEDVERRSSSGGGGEAWTPRQNVSGVGTMGTRKVGGSWAMARGAYSEGAGPVEQAGGRNERGRYSNLSASSDPSTSTSAGPSPHHPSSFSPYPNHQQGFPSTSSSTSARPLAPPRSVSSSSAAGWTTHPSSSSYTSPLHHSVPSHSHSSSFPSQNVGGTVTSSADYYSPPQYPSHDPYGPNPSYPPPPQPISYNSLPLAYSEEQPRVYHTSPPPPRSHSYASRPAMPSRSKTTDNFRPKSSSNASSSHPPASTIRKKKSSSALASSYTHAAVFSPTGHHSHPSSRSPSTSASHPLPSSSSLNTTATNSSRNPAAGSESPPKKSHGPLRSPGHTPRPPNSWILYRSDTIKKIKDAKSRGEEFPVPAGIWNDPSIPAGPDGTLDLPHQGDVSKMISLLWKNESKEVRLRYDKLSAVRKAEHARLYPNYKYQPQRKNPITIASIVPGSLSPKKKLSPPLPSSEFITPTIDSTSTFPSSSTTLRKSAASKKKVVAKEPKSRNSPYARAPNEKSPDGDSSMHLQTWAIPLPANGLEGVESSEEQFAVVQRQIAAELAFRASGGEEGGFGGGTVDPAVADEFSVPEREEGDDAYETETTPTAANPQQILSSAYSNRTFDESYVPPASGFLPSQLAAASSYDFAEPQPTTYELSNFEPADASSNYIIYSEYPSNAGETSGTSSSFSTNLQAPLFTPSGVNSPLSQSDEPQDPNHYAAMWCLLEDDAPNGDDELSGSLGGDASWADGTWDVIGEGGMAVPMGYSFPEGEEGMEGSMEAGVDGEGGAEGLGLGLNGERDRGAGRMMMMMDGTEGAGDMVMLGEGGQPGSMTVAELVRAQWEQDRARYQATEEGGEDESRRDEGYEEEFQEHLEGEEDGDQGEEVSYGGEDVSRHDSGVHWTSEPEFSSHPAFVAPVVNTHPNYINARASTSSQPYANDESLSSSPNKTSKPKKSRRPAAVAVPSQETYPDHHLPALAPPLPLDAQPGYLKLKVQSQSHGAYSRPTSWNYSSSPSEPPRWSSSNPNPQQQYYTPAPPPTQQQQGWSPSWQLSPPSPPRSSSSSINRNSPRQPSPQPPSHYSPQPQPYAESSRPLQEAQGYSPSYHHPQEQYQQQQQQQQYYAPPQPAYQQYQQHSSSSSPDPHQRPSPQQQQQPYYQYAPSPPAPNYIPTTSSSTRTEIFSPPFVPLRSTSGSFRANSTSRPPPGTTGAEIQISDSLHAPGRIEDDGGGGGASEGEEVAVGLGALTFDSPLEVGMNGSGFGKGGGEGLSGGGGEKEGGGGGQAPRRTRRVVGGSFRGSS